MTKQLIPLIPAEVHPISLSLRFNGHFPGEPGLASVYWSKRWWRWWWPSWTTGAISRAKLQSNHHHQQTNIQFFYRPDALPVTQPTVSKHWREINPHLPPCKNSCHHCWYSCQSTFNAYLSLVIPEYQSWCIVLYSIYTGIGFERSCWRILFCHQMHSNGSITVKCASIYAFLYCPHGSRGSAATSDSIPTGFPRGVPVIPIPMHLFTACTTFQFLVN